MKDEEIFTVISKNWPDKNVADIKSWIRQEYRDIAAETERVTRERIFADIETASRVIDWEEDMGKWRELPEESWEKIKKGETPAPCPDK